MKRIHSIIITIAAILAFVAVQDAAAENKKGAKVIDSKEFSTKVYDMSSDVRKYLGDRPAIVDFYASWCGPCRAISPILDEIAKEYDGKIVVYKVNIDASPDLAKAFGIRSIPAVMYIPMEGKASITLGSRSKSQFVKEIDSMLLAK